MAAVLLLLWAGLAAGHEVDHAIMPVAAVAVHLSYADGKPFAYERYELTPAGQAVPLQVGNTDALGRVVFVPGEHRNWRLKAYSADGHGADLEFTAPGTRGATPATTADPDRTTRIAAGLALLFGMFGLLQLFLHRRKS